ncbi:MAG: PIN domain-containing protein [Xanthomonadales bacterium]|nr:PIN domain-containing protein [Xanthomonadales bacterium]
MYLVDTSVWVDYIRGSETVVVEFLDNLLLMPMVVGLTDQIYMEILQGARSEAGFEKLQRYFSTQIFYRFKDFQLSHESAARLFFKCRCQGITVRSSNDCLTAQYALENELILLHHDKDFIQLGKIAPKLQQKHFLD